MITLRATDDVQISRCEPELAASAGWPPGDYLALRCAGETAVAIVPANAGRDELGQAIRWLCDHRERARRAADFWAKRCVAAYERVAGESVPKTVRRVA